MSKIRQIREEGKDVDYKIVRHGLTEKEAFEVESALIDFVGLDVLSNLVAGHQMARRGQMSVGEIIALYRAEKITISEPCIFVIVNTLYEQNITSEKLYEITRGNWVMGIRREKAQYAFCVYKGLVREVYKINSWESVAARRLSSRTQKRWRFDGEVAAELRHYVGGSVEHYLKKAQSPVRYINC